MEYQSLVRTPCAPGVHNYYDVLLGSPSTRQLSDAEESLILRTRIAASICMHRDQAFLKGRRGRESWVYIRDASRVARTCSSERTSSDARPTLYRDHRSGRNSASPSSAAVRPQSLDYRYE